MEMGKPLISILRSGHSSNTTLGDIVNSTRDDWSTPRELAVVISTKFRFIVQVTAKSFESESGRPSYQVHRIDTNFGKQTHSSALQRRLAAATSSKPGTRQFPLVLGSSSGSQSPSSSTATLDGLKVVADSADTNSAYLLPARATPPSVNKLPNPRSRVVSFTSEARKALFQETDCHDQTGQIIDDSATGSLALSTLSTDGPTVEESLVSGDLENLSSTSQAIGKLETASAKLRVLPSCKTAADKNSVLQKVVEEAVPTASVDAPKSALPVEPLADKRRRSPYMKSAAGTAPKKNKNQVTRGYCHFGPAWSRP